MVIAKLIRLCLGIVKKILKLAVVVILCLVILSLIPSLPPYIEYNAYNVTPPVPLKGALGINTLLNNAERLYEGALKGPEAFDVYNGALYTGLHGGEIVKLGDGNIVPVAKFGLPCEGFWEEKKCGRPLGMKFSRDGFLYVADAYYGLFKVNVNDGTKIKLVSVNDSIKDKPIKLPNSVDVAEDGTVYWTISSSEFHLEDGIFDMLADGSGRLLRYDPKKKTNEVLIDNLHFANGVVLSSNEQFVLVAETARSRIHRYYLKGPKMGVHDIFLDGLPGLPDNLKSDGSSGFFIPLVLGRDSSNPVLFQSLGPFPSIRRAFSRFLALLELFFWQIDSIYPNYYAKRAIHFIGHFESMHGIGPKRITILHVDENGKIKSSYHSTDGKLSGISEVHWFNGAFYLGSPYNTYVGRVALDIPELRNQKRLPIKQEPVLRKQAQDQGQLKKQTKQEQEKRPVTEQKPSEPAVQQKHSAQEKRPVTEQKPSEPAVQQKHSAQVKKPTSSDIHQQKQSFKEEKVPVKQENKEQSKPVQQPKQSLESDKLTAQQRKEQPKVQSAKEEKPSVQQQKPLLQQRKETVNEGKQSAGQQKPQLASPKPPVPQQKQQSTESPKPAAHQQKQQQQRPVEGSKSATHQQKQQQAAEVPKPTAQQQKKQSAETPKPPAEQQRQQQQSAEIPKSAASQQKQQQKHSTEVPKPAAQQQKQQQQKLEGTNKKVEVKQEKQLNEQKKVPLQKSQSRETKPQVQQQRNVVKEETLPVQQREQPVKHKPAMQQQKSQPQESKSQKQQQQKYPTKEEQPMTQQQKKKAANQQEPVEVQKASAQQPVQGKKPVQQEKSSPQQVQAAKASNQKPKVQDKIPTNEQHPPK